jgi:hypothetical protein
MVQFTRQRYGTYKTQIENLEVTVSPVGYELVVWDEVTDTDCDYDGCQENDDMDACIAAHDGHCPREFKERQQISNDFVGGLSSFEEVEASIRNKFKKVFKPYPRHAALRLATEDWAFVDCRPTSTTRRARRQRV